MRPSWGVHSSVKLLKHKDDKLPSLHEPFVEVFSGLATGFAVVIAENKRVKRTVWGMLHHICRVLPSGRRFKEDLKDRCLT